MLRQCKKKIEQNIHALYSDRIQDIRRYFDLQKETHFLSGIPLRPLYDIG